MKRALGLSIGLFIAACALPALVLHTGQHLNLGAWVWKGYQSLTGMSLLLTGLLLGWLRMNFTAFANIPLWLSWLFVARGRFAAARNCSTLSLILSLETMQLIIQPYWFDEGATLEGYLATPHVGFFCWVGSMLVIWLYSSRALRRQSRGLSVKR